MGKYKSSGETHWPIISGYLLLEIRIKWKKSTLFLLIFTSLHSNLTFAFKTSDYEMPVDIFIDLCLISSGVPETIFSVASGSCHFYDIGTYTAWLE